MAAPIAPEQVIWRENISKLTGVCPFVVRNMFKKSTRLTIRLEITDITYLKLARTDKIEQTAGFGTTYTDAPIYYLHRIQRRLTIKKTE